MSKEHVAVVGSRRFPDESFVRRWVCKHMMPDYHVLLSGGATGPDTWAAETFRDMGGEVLIYPAHWQRYGRSAGFRRNVDIARDCHRCVCFWDGESSGALDTALLVVGQRKPVELHIRTVGGADD